MDDKKMCIVAIVKNEEPFLNEWLIYHKLLGVNHFFLYDDDPQHPLQRFLAPTHQEYTTIVPWSGTHISCGEGLNQIKAYNHAVNNFVLNFEWVSFLDIDEFIVLRKWDSIGEFLSKFPQRASISLNWHVFGHNGYYNTPPGLITSSLIRRMSSPSKNVKSITRSLTIKEIKSAHFCHLHFGARVDANDKTYNDEIYEGKTINAHINHYQCRSFEDWMRRVERGDVNFGKEMCPPEHKWRLEQEACLKQFVTTVALNKNEYVDDFMLKFRNQLESQILKLNFDRK